MEKCIFSRTSEMSFSLGYKLLKLYCFWERRFGRDERSEVSNDNFLVFISVIGILGMILPYVKIFFWPLK